MKKLRYIRAVLLISLFFLGWQIPGFCQLNDTVTITTYYPSPFGAFQELDIKNKVIFKDSGAFPQDLEIYTDGSSNLVLNVATNPTPLSPAQIYFNDSAGIKPFSYLQIYNSSGGTTYCAVGYLAVNFLLSDKTPADPNDLPASGFYVCLRGW